MIKVSILFGVYALTTGTIADDRLQGWDALYQAVLNQVKVNTLIEKFDPQCTHRVQIKNAQGETRQKVFSMANPEFSTLGVFRYEYVADSFLPTAFDISSELAPKVQSILIELRKLKGEGYASLAPAIKLNSKDAPLLIEKTLKSVSEFKFEQNCSKLKTTQDRKQLRK